MNHPNSTCHNAKDTKRNSNLITNILVSFIHVVIISIWWNLNTISNYITYHLLSLTPNTKLAESVHFFIKDMPFIFILLALIVFWIGILRSVLHPEKLRRFLVGKSKVRGYILSAMIGSITPFCSCSAIPLFIGMMQARIPLGITFTYLISSPMINEIAFIMLWAIIGWQVAIIYYLTGLVLALVGGFIIDKLKMEKYVESWVYQDNMQTPGCTSGCNSNEKQIPTSLRNWSQKIGFAYRESYEMIRKVGLYIIIGIGIGAAIHGYVPTSALSYIMGDAWWAVLVSVLIALPLYDNAGGVIPVVQALLSKGAALGTVLSFMMSITAISLPELLILKKVMKFPLITTFVAIIGVGIILIGYFFNYLFSLGIIHT